MLRVNIKDNQAFLILISENKLASSIVRSDKSTSSIRAESRFPKLFSHFEYTAWNTLKQCDVWKMLRFPSLTIQALSMHCMLNIQNTCITNIQVIWKSWTTSSGSRGGVNRRQGYKSFTSWLKCSNIKYNSYYDQKGQKSEIYVFSVFIYQYPAIVTAMILRTKW